MLPPHEKAFAKELLSALEQEELFQLAKTSSNGNLNPNSKQDAIDIITSYEEDARTLLSRKKITKALLFNYLHWKRDPPSANADKNALVENVVRLWQTVKDPGAISSDVALNQVQNKTSETQSDVDVESRETTVDTMALKFSEWFYNLMNKDFTNEGGPLLKEDDFWKECIVSVHIDYGTNCETVKADSNVDAVNILRNVVRTHKLFFSPNLTKQGIRGKLEPHGFVLIIVCGTLHQGAGECVGIFEQCFMLIKDPIQSNNWKIKKTEMVLKTKNDVNNPPILDESGIGTLVSLSHTY